MKCWHVIYSGLPRFGLRHDLYASMDPYLCLGASYTLLKKGHIRTDLLYNNWKPQETGKVDAILYLVCFFPGMIFYLISGIDYAAHSWATNEKSSNSPWMPIIYPFRRVPGNGRSSPDPGVSEVPEESSCLEEGGMEMSGELLASSCWLSCSG